MDKDDADAYYYFNKEFYESIMRDLKDHVIWMYTMKDDIVTAIAIFLFVNGQMHYHLSGMRREHQNIAPMNLLFMRLQDGLAGVVTRHFTWAAESVRGMAAYINLKNHFTVEMMQSFMLVERFLMRKYIKD